MIIKTVGKEVCMVERICGYYLDTFFAGHETVTSNDRVTDCVSVSGTWAWPRRKLTKDDVLLRLLLPATVAAPVSDSDAQN